MLHYSMEWMASVGQLQALNVPELFSLELVWHDLRENMQRALHNIYELDGIGQKKLGFFIALYVVFACVVSKVLSPRKKRLAFKEK